MNVQQKPPDMRWRPRHWQRRGPADRQRCLLHKKPSSTFFLRTVNGRAGRLFQKVKLKHEPQDRRPRAAEGPAFAVSQPVLGGT